MSRSSLVTLFLAGLLTGACGGKTPPVTSPTPAPPTQQPSAPAVSGGAQPVRPPTPPAPPPIISSEPIVASDPLATADIDEINKQSPLAPVLFAYDSDSIGEEGQRVLTANANVLKKYVTWAVTIEGHSDERGTAEYNLALGERRALAAKSYLLSLGIAADRIRTVSYGKEFPFDPGHDEAAWAKNRRGHFVVTAK